MASASFIDDVVIDTSKLIAIKRHKPPFHIAKRKADDAKKPQYAAFLAEQLQAKKEQQLRDEQAEKQSKELGLTRTASAGDIIAVKQEPGTDKMELSPEDAERLEKQEALKELEKRIAELEGKVSGLEDEKHQMFAQLKQVLMEEEKRKQEEQKQQEEERRQQLAEQEQKMEVEQQQQQQLASSFGANPPGGLSSSGQPSYGAPYNQTPTPGKSNYYSYSSEGYGGSSSYREGGGGGGGYGRYNNSYSRGTDESKRNRDRPSSPRDGRESGPYPGTRDYSGPREGGGSSYGQRETAYNSGPRDSGFSGAREGGSYSNSGPRDPARDSAAYNSGPRDGGGYNAAPRNDSYYGGRDSAAYNSGPGSRDGGGSNFSVLKDSGSNPPSSYSPRDSYNYNSGPRDSGGSGFSAQREGGGYSGPRDEGGSTYSAPRDGGGYSGSRDAGGASYSAPKDGSGYSAPRDSGSSVYSPRDGGYAGPRDGGNYSAPRDTTNSYPTNTGGWGSSASTQQNPGNSGRGTYQQYDQRYTQPYR